MKQNTPMQKLIEFIETMPATNTPATEIRIKATELMQEEREVIEKAYDEDLYGGLSGKKKYDNGSDYYTQTYGGNNEK